MLIVLSVDSNTGLSVFPATVGNNTIIIVHFVDKETDIKRLRNVPSATELASSPGNRVSDLVLVTNMHTGQPAMGLTSTLSPMMLKG